MFRVGEKERGPVYVNSLVLIKLAPNYLEDHYQPNSASSYSSFYKNKEITKYIHLMTLRERVKTQTTKEDSWKKRESFT